MEIIGSLIIALAIMGIPSYLIFRIFKKFDENKIVYSSKKLLKDFKEDSICRIGGLTYYLGGYFLL